MVNGKQITVCWHVDDLKVSHVDTNEVTNMINWLKVTYEDEIGKMVVSRGKIHWYLGMTLDYSTPGKVNIDMVDYDKKMIEDFLEEIVATAKTPASNQLFKVNEDAAKLEAVKSQNFHTMVAKALFVCKRARLDIQTAVAFLTTRVKGPDVDAVSYTHLTLPTICSV